MGNCTSQRFASVVAAKLIHLDGHLEEFSYPVKVSELLKKNPDCFICNSDEMEFDVAVTAMDGDRELRPGKLYFELPLVFLKRRLKPEDMASLAIKASLALSNYHMMKYGCCRSPRGRVVVEDPLMFLREENVKVKKGGSVKGVAEVCSTAVVPEADYCDLRVARSRRPAARMAGRVSKFTATLSSILEVEE